jgi:hypothetical protein
MEPELESFTEYTKNKPISIGDKLILRDDSETVFATGLVEAILKDPKVHSIVSWSGKDYQSEKKFAEAAVAQKRKDGDLKFSGNVFDHLFVAPAGVRRC